MMQALRRYYRGATLAAMEEVQTGRRLNYHFDHQGTVQCLTDDTGAVTDRFASDAWGVPVKRTGTSINRQWYVGSLGYYRQVDQALDYVRARYYRPEIAVWLSEDPLPDTARFQYGESRPTFLTDPTGLWCCAPEWEQDLCPKPCDRDSNNKPVQPPRRPTCQVTFKQLKDIETICTADWPPGNKTFPRAQAFTKCCIRYYCATGGLCKEGDTPIGSGKCQHTTGCTEVQLGSNPPLTFWNQLPDIWKLCIWEHERRRKLLCRCSGGSDNGGTMEMPDSEKNRTLACVERELRRCKLRTPHCRPFGPVRPFVPRPGACVW